MERTSNATCSVCVKGFYSDESKKAFHEGYRRKDSRRTRDALWGQRLFLPTSRVFVTAEVHWANLGRLFMFADYTKKHNPSVAEKITAYSRRIVDLFHQTKDYASGWDSEHKEKHRLSTEDYVEATDESWDALDKWVVTQEKLRCLILEFAKFLYSVAGMHSSNF